MCFSHIQELLIVSRDANGRLSLQKTMEESLEENQSLSTYYNTQINTIPESELLYSVSTKLSTFLLFCVEMSFPYTKLCL